MCFIYDLSMKGALDYVNAQKLYKNTGQIGLRIKYRLPTP